ncbi:GNAT family N-acetyltransferase [Jiulongibacter sediminis]|jgi:ribosomal protein S18 acetylase RimI-like enzyme|uniref:GNAT family N-acetyltransferase n=1 Tax=Jiulongibacter sediminis TaxID=1605367 RepID=UPI0026F22B75|nr:GNAT family N-acetyltransferase [Jiulongibacter sediminis]
MEIRKGTIADAEMLSEIGTLSFIESHGLSGPQADIEAYAKKYFTPESFEAELKEPSNVYYIIFCEGKPAGYSKIIFNSPHFNVPESRVTKLERLYLLKEFYGRNLGAELFNFNLNLSKEAGEKGLWLYVWKGNDRAIRFYQKQGFEIVGSHDFKISETHHNPNHQMFLKFQPQ